MADDVLVRLRMKAEQFSADVRKAFSGVPAEAERAGEASGESYARGLARKAGTITAVAAGIIGSIEAVRRSLDMAADIDRQAKEIGVGTTALQDWRYAMEQAGGEANDLDQTVGTLTRRVGEANAGSKTAQKAFVDLGVGFRTVDGHARSTEATFTDVIERLSKIEDPAERARVGTQLLGEEYRKLEPLARGGAAGLREASGELDAMNARLTPDQIENLKQMNNEYDRMKQILSVSVAGVVADNADAITGLTQALANLAVKSLQVAANYPKALSVLGAAAIGGRIGGLPGAIIGGGLGLVAEQYVEREQRDASLDPKVRSAELENSRKALERMQRAAQTGGSLFAIHRANTAGGTLKGAQDEYERQKKLYQGALDYQKAVKELEKSEAAAASPRVDPKAARARGGRGRSAAADGKSDEDRERERAAKEALRNEQAYEKAIQRTLDVQSDSARVEQIRAEQGDVAAAAAKARLDFERQFPAVTAETVEQLGEMLGLSKEQVEVDRAHLQNLINAGKAAADATANAASAEAQRRIDEQAARERQRAAEEEMRFREDQLRELSGMYEELFTHGTGRIWRDFKHQGMAVLAEITAQYTLALLSGQKAPDFGTAAGQALGGLPLGTLFGGAGRRTAANDNGVVSGAGLFNPGLFGGGRAIVAGDQQPLPGSDGIVVTGAKPSLLNKAGVAIAASSIANMVHLGGRGAGSQIGGLVGSIGGQALGSSLAMLGSFGGPVGALAGALLGSVVGGLFGGGTKSGRVTLSGGGAVLGGTSKSLQGQAAQQGDSFQQQLDQIAEALGGTRGSFGSITLGERNGAFRVNVGGTGKGSLKLSHGAHDFGSDQEAAIAYAVNQAISHGAIQGISAASQRILASGQDLEKAIEKATLIESVPKLLKERLDPLGAALDALADKYKQLADALKEGGATADQVAQAEKLYNLERQDTIKQYGAASQQLKEFADSLMAGSNSPLSLRQQKIAAEAQLAPFTQQIQAAQDARARADQLKAGGASDADLKAAEDAARAAAAAIDQQGFQAAAQLLLGVSRQMDASGGGFFADFDRIRQLTGFGIGAIDSATASTGQADPFAALQAQQTTAQNTLDMANILANHTLLLQAINDNLRGGPAKVGLPTYITDQRAYLVPASTLLQGAG